MKIHIFHLKCTDDNKFVLESPEAIIRKLLSIHTEKEKSLKASKHAKKHDF